MADEVPNLKGADFKFWLPLVLSLTWSAATVVWFAAKYPDRTEHNDVLLRIGRVEIELVKASSNAESSRASIERVEAKQQRFEDKLDEAIRQKDGRRGAR